MELDEVHSYVGHKKTIDGYGWVLIETPKNTLISLLCISPESVVDKVFRLEREVHIENIV